MSHLEIIESPKEEVRVVLLKLKLEVDSMPFLKGK